MERAEALISDIRLIQTEAVELTDDLSQEQFEWRPDDDAWSIAQCIEHLNTATGTLVPRLRDAVTEPRADRAGTSPYRLSTFERMFAWMMSPRFRLSMKSPRGYQPAASSLVKADVVERFVALQDELQEIVESSRDPAVARVKVASPVLSHLRMTIAGWLASTIAHEQRHLGQARRIRSLPEFPSVAESA